MNAKEQLRILARDLNATGKEVATQLERVCSMVQSVDTLVTMLAPVEAGPEPTSAMAGGEPPAHLFTATHRGQTIQYLGTVGQSLTFTIGQPLPGAVPPEAVEEFTKMAAEVVASRERREAQPVPLVAPAMGEPVDWSRFVDWPRIGVNCG